MRMTVETRVKADETSRRQALQRVALDVQRQVGEALLEQAHGARTLCTARAYLAGNRRAARAAGTVVRIMSAHELAPRLPWTARALSHQWAALAVVLTGTFMVVLDFFIVNVAMPAMQTDLHAGTGAIEWVIAGYGLTFATFLITAGRLGDQLGRRRMFSLGLAAVHARVGGVRPGAEPGRARRRAPRAGAGRRRCSARRCCRSSASPTPAPTASARSASTASSSGFAAVGGQLIGGVLVQADIAGLGWRSCFLINVPIGLVALARRRARGARVARRGRPPPGPRRDRADHARSRRHRPAARRGPPARLAGVDVAVPGRRAGHPRACSPPTSGA